MRMTIVDTTTTIYAPYFSLRCFLFGHAKPNKDNRCERCKFKFGIPDFEGCPTPPKRFQEWEYITVNAEFYKVSDEVLNKYGAMGWEMVATTISPGYKTSYFFKRLKP